MTRHGGIGAMLVTCALIAGCSASPGADPTKVTITSRPQRVLTIGTPAVDALYAAGASDRVVARAGEYDVPATGPAGAAVESKPVIDPMQPTLEAVLGSKADIVIGYGLGKTYLFSDSVGVRRWWPVGCAFGVSA